jgi:hypothetical protein
MSVFLRRGSRDGSCRLVLFLLEPAGEQVQGLERPAERRFRRWWCHLEPRRPHVVAGGGAHAEVVQRVLRLAERFRRCNPASSALLLWPQGRQIIVSCQQYSCIAT